MAHYRRATVAGFKHVEIKSINSLGAVGYRVTIGAGRTYDYIRTPTVNDSTNHMTQEPDGSWHVTD
jgi:hypothetical protein